MHSLPPALILVSVFGLFLRELSGKVFEGPTSLLTLAVEDFIPLPIALLGPLVFTVASWCCSQFSLGKFAGVSVRRKTWPTFT